MALNVGTLFAELRLDSRGFDAGVNAAKSSLQGVDAGAQKVQGSISKLGSVIGTVGKASALAFAGASVAVAGLGAAALKSGISYNALQQSSRAALTTILGSAQAANAQMDKLDDFAKNSPFAKQVFIRAQQQLLGFGLAADKVIPSLDAIQNAVAAVGGSNDDIGNITYALAQMQGQGKLTGETLNQLGQYGIDAATILGAQFGKTGKEIREMASKPGGIPVEQVWDPLVAGLQEKFGGAAANVKQTWAGATDRIKAAWRDIGAALAEPFVGHTGGGVAIDWVNKFADLMRSLQKQIAPIMEAFKPLIDAIGAGVSSALDAAKRAVDGFDTSRLVAGINQAVEGFRGLIDALRSGGIAGLLQAIARQFDAFAQSMFGGGYTAAKTFAQGMVDGAAQFVTQAIDYITGLIASYLIGHSPTEEGPLSEIDKGGQAVMEAYVGGMKDGAGGAQEVAGDIADSLEAVGDNAADADGHIRDLTSSINDLRDQQDAIKQQISDIEQSYQRVIDPLEQQVDLLTKAKDVAQERKDLALDLEDIQLREARLAAEGDPARRAELATQLAQVEAQQESHDLAKRIQETREKIANAKPEDDVEGLRLKLQELQIQQQINGLSDHGKLAEIEGQEILLGAQKEQHDLTKKEHETQGKILALPLEAKIKALKAQQEEATAPLREQQELLSRRQEILESEKRKWSEIKSEIAAAKAETKAAGGGSKAKGGAKGGSGGGLELPSGGLIEGVPTQAIEESTESPVEEAGKQAGQSFALGFSDGIGAFIQNNLGRVIGGAIGGLAGGAVLGPPGALLGGLLGSFIGQGVQDELAKRGIDVSPLFSNLSEIGSSILEGIAGPIQRVADDIFPILRDRWNEIAPEITETLGTLGTAFDQFVKFAAPLVEGLWSGMVPIIDGASKIIIGIVRFFLNVIQLDWGGAWDAVKAILDGAWKIISTILFSGLDGAKKSLGDAWDWVKRKTDDIWEGIKGALKSAWEWIKGRADDLWGQIKSAVTGPVESLASWLGTKWDEVKRTADSAWTWLKTTADQKWDGIKGAVMGPIDFAKGWLDDQWEKIKTKASDSWTAIKTGIENNKQGIIDALKAPFEWFRDNVGGIVGAGKGAIRNSLNTVLNGFEFLAQKIIDAINWIPQQLGLGNILNVSVPNWEIPAFASGVENFAGGLAIVGEEGPELVRLPKGSDVLPADKTARMLSAKGLEPGFGGGFFDTIAGTIGDIAGSVADTVKGWLDKGARWVLDRAFGSVGRLAMGSNFDRMVPGLLLKFKDHLEPFVSDLLDSLKDKLVGEFDGTWINPVPGGVFMQGSYGSYSHSRIPAVDLAAPRGTPILAPGGGKVEQMGWNLSGATGPTAILRHGPDWQTLYGHISALLKGVGSLVKQGERFARVGSPEIDGGAGSGAHLHFEMWRNGMRVRPEDYIPFANGGVIRQPTLALLGETARARPEIVTPERLMRQVFADELKGRTGVVINLNLSGPVYARNEQEARRFADNTARTIEDRLRRAGLT